MTYTAICLDKLVVKAMRRLANVRCVIKLGKAGDGNAMVSCEVMCESECGEDNAKVSFSEAQRHALCEGSAQESSL